MNKMKKITSQPYKVGQSYEWTGGKQPVPDDTEIFVILRNSIKDRCMAKQLRWNHEDSPGDIVKFTVYKYPENVPYFSIELPKDVEDDLIEASENASYAPRVMTLYHATTPAKAKKYRDCGAIHGPVRGFTTLQAAMAWALKVNRTVIYEIFCEDAHKLPDHHNRFGDAWWNDGNVTDFKCVFSADSDA